MMLSWIVLLVGIEIGIRTDAFRQLFSITSANKLRFICYFAAWIVSLLFVWMGISSFFSWYAVMLALILLPMLKILLRHMRRSQIPMKSLAFLDLVLLNMKGGQSLRKSLSAATEAEKSWFSSFQLSLMKNLELGQRLETESEWFNVWASEIIQIEKSRNKVVEQLEILRRYTRQEQNFKKKMKNASAGPRAQVFVMSILFFGLNVVAFRNLQTEQLKTLLPMAWFLYFLGVGSIFIVMRSFKWKV